ncbi:MAG: hypothetical protein RL349_1665 [Bacteroidota bacterium]|jgi:hypothetical protein
MIGAISNPKKTLVIDFSIEKLKSIVELIPLLNSKYKFTSKNEILNSFTFEALEFLSLGIFADINFSKQDESRTEISIEIRRKVGAFDQAHEVSKANEHIAVLYELISKCLVLTEAEVTELETKKKSTPEKKGCMIAVLLTIGSLLGGSVIYAMV